MLLKPAEEQLAGKTRLIIVPDGILWRLPFAALQPADDRYLIDQASISYAPSLSALREMRKPRNAPSPRARNSKATASPLTLAAFGNPVIPPSVLGRLRPEQAADKNEPNTNATEAKPGQAPQPFRERALDQPSAEVEIQKLVPVYGNAQSRLFVAAEASEEHARIEMNRANTVLHFAVPTILDDAIPMFSFSALSGLSGQQDGPVGDGLLQPWEIMNLDTRARLVVLSAAEMSGGRVGPGDAVAALTWAWFVAGTPSLTLTRWLVRSDALTQFMSDFHAGVKSGSSIGPKARLRQTGSSIKAEAIRQSMLTLRRSTDYQHPYYWSTFMLVGDGR